MKKIFILWILLLSALFAKAQVQRVEYFIDTDPGRGKATRVTAASSKISETTAHYDESFTFDVPVPSTLSDGFHTLYVRAKNKHGWSQTMRRQFVKMALPKDKTSDVKRLEFFVDTDPGYGKGTAIALGANNGSYDFTVNLSKLKDGMHTLYVRAQNKAGRWSQVMRRTFVQVALPANGTSDMVYAEYFVDEDPGLRKGHSISLNSGSGAGDYSFTADVSDLSYGFHMLYVRSLNKYGRWSQVMRRPFVKTVLPTDLPPDLTYMEYYIDTDPGQGKGKSITFKAGAQTIDFTADLTGVAAGSHTLKIRAKNKANKWEDVGTHTFTIVGGVIDVELNQKTLQMSVGDVAILTAIAAGNPNLQWSSSDASIASVDQNGNVTAHKTGTATITVDASNASGIGRATCTVTVTNQSIPVTGIQLPVSKLELKVGDEYWMTASLIPSNATNRTVTWSSSNTAVATIDEYGKIIARTAGATTITVTSSNGKTAQCALTVNADVVHVSGVYLHTTDLEMKTGSNYSLSYYITPSNATNKAVTWKSSNTAVATVDATGKVTAVAVGTATITVTTTDGGKTATCQVKVVSNNIAVEGITLDYTRLVLRKGQTFQMTGYTTPVNATNQNVSWSSNQASVASVDTKGLITAKELGTTVITVVTIDGSKTAQCTVEVVEGIVPVTGVYLYQSQVELKKGEMFGLTGYITPVDATDQSVIWTSSNKSVVTVDTRGTITAVNPGFAYITVTTRSEGKQATCLVVVASDAKAVTGVTLNQSTLTLNKDATAQLTATVAPADAANKSVTWSTSNAAVATVSQTGLVTAVGSGTATITVTTLDGGKTATCAVTVNAPTNVTVTGVTLDQSTLNLNKNATAQLTATVAPSSATNKSVTWSTSDASVATVSQTGLVTAVGSGTATITVTTVDAGKTANCTVNVKVPVTGIRLDSDSKTLKVGDTWQITGNVLPEDATEQRVTYNSSNTGVATVRGDGIVTAVAKGTAVITVTTIEGAYTATVAITVTDDATGIDDPELIAITAYPNPVGETLFVKNDALNITRIEIVDMSGKILSVTGETSNAIITIPFQSYANGTYLVKMYTKTQSKTIKVVKQ